MNAVASRSGTARRAALGTTVALAGVMTAGVSAAFMALLVTDQTCSVPQDTPSADAQQAIPAVMLTAYRTAGSEYKPAVGDLGRDRQRGMR
jgi:hypothetical protein